MTGVKFFKLVDIEIVAHFVFQTLFGAARHLANRLHHARQLGGKGRQTVGPDDQERDHTDQQQLFES